MASEIEMAWAAGLFEGEGSCHVSSGQGQTVVQLRMVDRDVVERFADIVGRGSVRRYRNGRGSDGMVRQDVWSWSVQGAEDVRAVLGSLWPLLGERRKQQAYEVLERAAKIGEWRGFCKHGHDLSDPAHLYVHKKTGKRHCRTCRREYARRWYSRLAS